MKKQTGNIHGLLTLLVFALFVLCTGLTLLTGVGSYRNILKNGQETFQSRTAVRYLTTRFRQAETIRLEDFGGCEALVLEEIIDEETYLTRIYCHGGFLRELFGTREAQLHPEDGEKLLLANNLSLSIEEGMLWAEIDGQILMLSLRGKEAALCAAK